MPILGPHTLLDNNMPSGVDWSLVTNFAMRDGMSMEEAMALAMTVAGQINEEVMVDYRSIVYLTEELYSTAVMGDGSRTMTPLASEFAEADGIVADEVGFMYFVEKYKDAVGWSTDFLREARRSRLSASLERIKERWRNRVDYDVVWRLLRTDERVMGSGFAPGWAVGTGTNVNFIPVDWRTYSFDSTHTHYAYTGATATAANILTAIEAGALHIQHHGYTGPKVAMVSDAFATLLLASNDKRIALFVPSDFRLLGGNTNSPISTLVGQVEGVPGETICVINTNNGLVTVKKHDRFPAAYLWVGKSFGEDSEMNPLHIRTDPLWGGFGLRPKAMITNSLPAELESVQFEAKHGVNVGNRLAGYAHYIANGASEYVNPTIS